MPVTHEPWLVALSLVVAIQGAYVGLNLAIRLATANGMRRRLLLAGAALSLAVAVWSMHFVGMLAARLPVPVDYLVFPTLLSFLVCVLVVGLAVFAAATASLTPRRLTAASVFMGGGIVSMHYIGMAALHASAHLAHAPAFVALSIVVAIAASGLALWLAAGGEGRPPLLLSATALGVAIAGMHYTAMAGLSIEPHGVPDPGAPALSTDLLAIVVAVVAFLVSGIFLLTLVPERAGSTGEAASPSNDWPQPIAPAQSPTLPAPVLPALMTPAPITPAPMTPAPVMPAAPEDALSAHRPVGDDGDTGHGTYAPLGGAGGPPNRPARKLPVERDGATHYVPVEAIVAVHANAHYAYIFDGNSKMFCPLAIGQIEARLDAARFARVHRSHIVNLERVTALRRSGDNGVIELAGEERCTVPVSRSRIRWLKTRLGQPRTDEAAE
jgi:NO-binding membrane sensor protein with MHYT domain